VSTETITTVLVAATAPDLTNLATAKDELQLQVSNTAHDAFLGRVITRISVAIANYCNRVLVPEQVQDVVDVARPGYPWHPPHGFPQIQLSRWPVLGIVSVSQQLDAATTLTLVQDTDYRLDTFTGRLERIDSGTCSAIAWESRLTTVRYTAGYGTLTTVTQAVPTTPFTVTINNALLSCDHAVTFASNGTALTRVTSAPATGQYSVAASASGAIYTFAAADVGKSVKITYAARDVPDDIADACLRMIVARFHARGRDPMLLQRETPEVGSQRFWVGGTAGQDGPFPPDITAVLDTYRTPVAV
jgi:hypothetical protein